MQIKCSEYRELSNSLHNCIRENMAVMQDHIFPSTLIAVKKMGHESNRFPTEEAPQRNLEKQHIMRIFQDVQVYYSGTLLPTLSLVLFSAVCINQIFGVKVNLLLF